MGLMSSLKEKLRKRGTKSKEEKERDMYMSDYR